MSSEKTIASAAPTGIGRMYGPIRPRTKAIGSTAAMTVRVARIVGLPTSATAVIAACKRRQPAHLEVAHDVLDHDDRVVHHDARDEDQREERDPIQRVAEDVVDEERQAKVTGTETKTTSAPRQPRKIAITMVTEMIAPSRWVSKLAGLLARGLSVVAGHRDLDVREGIRRPFSALDLVHHARRTTPVGVGASPLGHREGHRGAGPITGARAVRFGRWPPVPWANRT